jgi:hypothetical protein
MGEFMLFGIVATAVALTLGGYWWLVRRAQPPALLHHFHCPGCRQRFRYREGSLPDQAWCPHCMRRLRLPATSQL